MTHEAGTPRSSGTLQEALRLAAIFAVAKLLLQFALTLWTTHLGYSYFRDEFYYIACGRHLAWGYVDHGPIVAVQARLGELLFGDSVFALRILSALAGAATIFLGGVLTWVLGGRRPAQVLAMLGLLVTPQYIAVDGFLSMNSCEPVFWMVCVLAILLLQRGSSQRLWWTVFGCSAGIGLLNKPSMAFFLLALGLALLCTPQRRLFFTRWAGLGIALLLLLTLPNLLWQLHHQWPTLEFLRNGQAGHKTIVLNPVQFLLAQISTLHPANALLWITGVVALLRARSIRETRWLGLTYLIFFVLMFLLHAKDYYLEGIYPALFGAGAVAWEHRFAASTRVPAGRPLALLLYEAVLLITGVLILPMSSPVLRPHAWIRYTTALHLHDSQQETLATGPLPQFYADRFGWQQQVDTVVKAFHTLAPEERKRVCLFGGNYGEAGAIDFLGLRQEPALPPAISGQNNYWLWGTHGCDPNLVIAVISDKPTEVAKKYESVELIGRMDDLYAMPFEHKSVYLLRKRRSTAPFSWADERFYF